MEYTINLNDLKEEVMKVLMEMARDRKMDTGNMVKIIGMNSTEEKECDVASDFCVVIRDE